MLKRFWAWLNGTQDIGTTFEKDGKTYTITGSELAIIYDTRRLIKWLRTRFMI